VVADPTRLARLPGTTNQKTRNLAHFAYDPPQPLRGQNFREYLNAGLPYHDNDVISISVNLHPQPNAHWTKFVPWLSTEVADFLMFAQTPCAPDPWSSHQRNNMTYRSMLELLEAGMAYDDASTLVDAAAKRSGLGSIERSCVIRSATAKYGQKHPEKNLLTLVPRRAMLSLATVRPATVGRWGLGREGESRDTRGPPFYTKEPLMSLKDLEKHISTVSEIARSTERNRILDALKGKINTMRDAAIEESAPKTLIHRLSEQRGVILASDYMLAAIEELRGEQP